MHIFSKGEALLYYHLNKASAEPATVNPIRLCLPGLRMTDLYEKKLYVTIAGEYWIQHRSKKCFYRALIYFDRDITQNDEWSCYISLCIQKLEGEVSARPPSIELSTFYQ